MIFKRLIGSLAACFVATSPAFAITNAEVIRIDATSVMVRWQDSDPVDAMLSDQPSLPKGTKPLIKGNRTGEVIIALPATQRGYVVLRDGGDKSLTILAEREVPLQGGSNFRDLGGYTGAGGRKLRWGKIFRSGALPMLTESDYALLGSLKIGSIVDLRSLEEREVAGTLLDDRTGALFLSNDYSLKPLMASFNTGNGEYTYAGMGKMLAPQYRSIFKRLLVDEGAVLYNCSAGQDRTGVASALILSALGVDRATILKDYHLSTKLRRPQNELPLIDAAKYPDNPIVQYYAAAAKKPGGLKAELLYSKSGIPHLTQFFEVLDRDYGSVEGYLSKELGISALDIVRLRARYLE